MQFAVWALAAVSIAPVQLSIPNGSIPAKQPQLAAAGKKTALVFASGNSVWFAASHDGGRSFSEATEVAKLPVLAAGRHRGPRVVFSGGAMVVSAVYGGKAATGPHAHGLPENGDLAAWRSTDEGKSWKGPVAINDVAGSAREGLHAMAAGKGGEVAAVWLDLRAPGTRLYGSSSRDGGASWSKNVLLYESPGGTICQCCDPSITAGRADGFQIMFRNVADGMRDMYLADWQLPGTVSPAQKLGAGSWSIEACPMDGGGIARYRAGVISAWRRDHTVYLDQPGQREMALGEGKDVSLAVGADGPYVAWSNARGIQVHTPSGKVLCLSQTGAYPVLAAAENGWVLAAWEQDGTIKAGLLE